MFIKNLFKRAVAVRNWLKKNRKLLMLLLVIVIMLILGGCFASPHAALAVVVAGVAGGKHIDDEPLTTDLTRGASPDLLLNEIDQQIVKIRPMATPIDQLSRCAGSKHAGSMIVDYYNVEAFITNNIQSLQVRVRYVLLCLLYDCIKFLLCPLDTTCFADVYPYIAHCSLIMGNSIIANVHTYHNANRFN